MEKKKITTHVSDEKKKSVSELAELAKSKKTILVASIKNIPSAQYQEIVKKLRGKAVVKVPKKSIIFRALDGSDGGEVKKLKEQIKDSSAILFSDMDSYELAGELLNSRNPAKAKAGQEAPEDIEVPAGPTELVPGPAISELGALGIQIQIDKGKINIKEPKVIAKEGEKISQGAADLMGKLDIKPFSVGFTPLAAFDTQEKKLYLEIKINKEETLEELRAAFGKALPFAVDIGYTTEDTIKFIIGKAGMHEKALEKFAGKEEKAEEKSEEKNAADANKVKDVNETGSNSKGDAGASSAQEGGSPESQPEKNQPEENKTQENSQEV